jgi:type II secretory ATPase GspE/PulE/Tfp pilus assembly ATPase PilB-like protein
MRDTATADIATQAALTGHLVFSTLHTNDAASAVTRLVDMGIEPYLVAATVQGIVAQRLVRRLCDECAEEYEPEPADVADMPLQPTREQTRGGRFRRAKGCDQCGQTGYRGRTGIYELLPLGEKHRTLIVKGASADELRALARADGCESLSVAAWRAVREGVTSITELRRVTNDESVA